MVRYSIANIIQQQKWFENTIGYVHCTFEKKGGWWLVESTAWKIINIVMRSRVVGGFIAETIKNARFRILRLFLDFPTDGLNGLHFWMHNNKLNTRFRL